MRRLARPDSSVTPAPRTAIPAALLAVVIWVTSAAAAPPPAPGCKSAFPAASSACTKDAQCCSGLVCQGRACRPGCRVGGTFYAPGGVNPANQCQTCQPAASVSAFTSRANGTTCNDGNACTRTDTCQAGVCSGSNPVACAALDQCHVAGTCNPTTGICSDPPKADGAACNDGNACTTVDTCQAGTCAGSSSITCSALDQCHDAGTCDPATGACSNPPKANGTACNDGNACTTGEQCISGSCGFGGAVFCIAPDECHVASACDPSTGCSVTAKANGSPCNDGSACTQSDACQAGVCAGSPVTCGAPDQCQNAGTCNPATGGCSYPPKPDGTGCNDANACTGGDRCLGGSCQGASQTLCFGDACHDGGTCDPQTGLCSNPPKANGTACNDGNSCTGGDICQAGVCTGAPVVCEFPGQCRNAGTCNAATGQCVYTSKPDGTVCFDGTGCTVGDVCQGGSCVGSPVICPDGIPSGCYTGLSDCNPQTGQCVVRPVPNGTACDDGNTCTATDTCQAGVCTGSPCSPGRACCSTDQPCADLGFDNANCGSCGAACTGSACLRGQCFDGCVIGGVGYAHGTLNPGNPCEVCDTGLTRTAWTQLGENYPNPPVYTCHVGCFTGFCTRGACSGLGGTPTGSVCGSASSCATSTCNSAGVCVSTPTNEGGACTPPLATNPCKGSTGTCHDGDCIAVNVNEDGYCRVSEDEVIQGDSADCRSPVDGKCKAGECVPNNVPDGTECHFVDFGYCGLGFCSNGICPSQTDLCTSGPIQCPSLTCDPAIGCVPTEPNPPSGDHTCGDGFSGPKPQNCCEGQVCICHPVPRGVPQFCMVYECWNIPDLPEGYLP